MSFPDRIERTMELDASPEKVWAALTTAEGLGTWFGNAATIDLLPGGTGQLSWTDGHSVDLRLERVEEPKVFGFTWPVEDLPLEQAHRTYVEFTLEPFGTGTRLIVVETGFAQLPDRAAYDSHSEGWTRELDELVDYLDAA